MPRNIKVNIFDDLKVALQDAAAYERGEPVNLRVTRIPARPKPLSPKEVRRIRRSLKASQALFATYLNVRPTPSAVGSKAPAVPAKPPLSSSPSPRKIPKLCL